MLAAENVHFCFIIFSIRLFNFDGSIDFSDKDVRCNKANCACQSPKCETDQECITKIKHYWNNFSNIKLKKKEQIVL